MRRAHFRWRQGRQHQIYFHQLHKWLIVKTTYATIDWISNPSSSTYFFFQGPSQPLRYFFWNGTSVAYPNKTISSTDSLIKWLVGKSNDDEPLTSWIGVIGRKSLSLSRKLLSGTGNSLVVFVPRINRLRSWSEPCAPTSVEKWAPWH